MLNINKKEISIDSGQYIGDVLFDELKHSLGNKKHVLIDAELGLGKTHLILGELIPLLDERMKAIEKSKGYAIYVLTNRDALKHQIMQQYPLDSDRIIVMNYQELENCTIDGKLDKKPFLFIADECHYFFCDSTFNETTDIVLELLLNHSNTRVVFMSATPRLLLEFIRKEFPDYTMDWFVIRRKERLKASIYYYWSELKQEETIESIIKDTYDKILFFRDNTEKNNGLAKKYGDIAVSISRSNKEKKGPSKDEYISITTKERIQDSTRFVLSTTVLNNGINILNEDIKNVFISDFYDIDDAVQCIGRRRIKEHEHLNIFVKIPSRGQLIKKKKEIEELLRVVHDKKNMTKKAFTRKYGRRFNRLLYIKSDEEGVLSWEINRVMHIKLLQQKKDIEAMIDKGGKYYINQLREALSYEIQNIDCIDPNSSDLLKEEMTGILSRYADKTLYSNRNTGKKSDIVSFMEVINTCKHLTEKFIVSDSPSPVKLKNMMKILGVPFTIESKTEKASKGGHLNETVWIIKKIGDFCERI